MLKEAINRILELDKPNEIEYAGRKFVDKDMSPLPRHTHPYHLSTQTLSSIADYINFGTDECFLDKSRFIIHIADYNQVCLFKELDEDGGRDCLLDVACRKNGFPFGRFMPLEQFNINLQSCFEQDENTAGLLQFIASVRDDTSVTQEDDGVTQTVTARQGISMVAKKKTPNPVTLRPFRTFSEAEQPASSFVFRMHKEDDSVTAALFEADGEAWKYVAIQNIRNYLEEAVKGIDSVIILA